jgi:hypothetical protein
VQVETAKLKARPGPPLARRARFGEKASEFWPPYDYQRKTEREMPVVVLDPVR